MLVSSFALKNSLEKYKKSKRRGKNNKSKRVKRSSALRSTQSSSNSALSVAAAVVFLILELIVLYYAIALAFSCTQKGPERIVNVILAVLFPFPYLMLNILLNGCAKSTLQSGKFSLN